MKSFDESEIDRLKNRSLVREDRVLGNIHLNVAIRYAKSNLDSGRMISKSLWNEILLYLSLQRQVHKAFEMVGVKNYAGRVIEVGYSTGNTRRPKIEASPRKERYWGVRSVQDLLERMAIFHIENH